MIRTFAATAALMLALPAVASAATNAEMLAVSTSLAPGQFAWSEGTLSTEPLTMSVSLDAQRMYVYRGEALVGVASVSTGRTGLATPEGEFNILQKARWHRSNLYSNSPMPFMQRLTWDGIALHAGHNPGKPASHGCIRLPMQFARDLFEMTRLGSPIRVERGGETRSVRIDIDWRSVDWHAVSWPAPSAFLPAAPGAPVMSYDWRALGN